LEKQLKDFDEVTTQADEKAFYEISRVKDGMYKEAKFEGPMWTSKDFWWDELNKELDSSSWMDRRAPPHEQVTTQADQKAFDEISRVKDGMHKEVKFEGPTWAPKDFWWDELNKELDIPSPAQALESSITVRIVLGKETSLGIGLNSDNIVDKVRASSAAERAGIKVGDVVLGWQGQPLGAKRLQDIMRPAPVHVLSIARGSALGSDARANPDGAALVFRPSNLEKDGQVAPSLPERGPLEV